MLRCDVVRGDLQRKEGSIGLRIDDDRLLPHNTGQLGVEAETSTQGMNGIVSSDVTAVSRKEAMIREGVHHRARPTNCAVLVGHGSK